MEIGIVWHLVGLVGVDERERVMSQFSQGENGVTIAEVFVGIEIGLTGRCNNYYETSEEEKPQVEKYK